MALIGKIRKNSWLLIVLIGLGLASFIIMDMFSGQTSAFGAQSMNIGSVNGEDIAWNDFSRTESILYNGGGEPFSRRQALWNYYVEDKLLKEEAADLGLSVGQDELMALQFGANPSPVIQQMFRNPQTQQLDRTQLDSFKKEIEDNTITGMRRTFWAEQEKRVIKDRLQTKLASMVTKGLFTPTWMAEQAHVEQNQKVNFNYVKIPYDKITADVKVSDADLKQYLNDNAALYTKDEETRKIEYLTLNVTATKEDSMAIRDELKGYTNVFSSTKDEDLTDYVANNYGSYQDRYLKESELRGVAPTTVSSLFSQAVGSIVGPYLENGNYKMAKIVDRRTLPDSAKSRHILISAQTDDQFKKAQVTIDSLRNLLETGVAQFDSLAIKFSQDSGSASKGGVYDNVPVNQFVPGYRDVIFFEGQIGKYYDVRTQYGIHLIEPMGRTIGNNDTYVKVAYLSQAIVPSEKTQDRIYEEAYELVNKTTTLDALKAAAAANPALDIDSSPMLRKNDFIVGPLGSGQSSRDIIRWAFSGDTGVGDVSPEVYIYQNQVNYFNNKYVIAALTAIQDEGKPALANIRDVIEPLVLKQKQAATVSGNNLDNLASTYGATVENASNISFNAVAIPGAGTEPKVIAAACNLQPNGVSAPIAGDSGVFMVQLVEKPALAAQANIPQMRQLATNKIKSSVERQLLDAIKKNADIEDNRATFY